MADESVSRVAGGPLRLAGDPRRRLLLIEIKAIEESAVIDYGLQENAIIVGVM